MIEPLLLDLPEPPPSADIEAYAAATLANKTELRRELHEKIEALNRAAILKSVEMRAQIEAFDHRLDPAKLDPAIEHLERSEEHSRQALAAYERTVRMLELALAKANKVARGSPPAAVLREHLADTRSKVVLARELCIAYRDLRWSLIANAAKFTAPGSGPIVSTPEEYDRAYGSRR